MRCKNTSAFQGDRGCKDYFLHFPGGTPGVGLLLLGSTVGITVLGWLVLIPVSTNVCHGRFPYQFGSSFHRTNAVNSFRSIHAGLRSVVALLLDLPQQAEVLARTEPAVKGRIFGPGASGRSGICRATDSRNVGHPLRIRLREANRPA